MLPAAGNHGSFGTRLEKQDLVQTDARVAEHVR